MFLGNKLHLQRVRRMMTRIVTARLLAAGVVAWMVGSCWLSNHQLEVVAGGYLDPIHQMEWPRNSGEYVRVNNSLTDSAGLAGLEVEVFTPDGRKRAVDARTFHGRRTLAYGPVQIEEYGEVQVFARLRRHDALTAEGHVSWTVDPDGYEKWQVLIVRIAHPGYADESLRCGVHCVKVKRIAIDEEFRNYPDEALWLVVRHLHGWEG